MALLLAQHENNNNIYKIYEDALEVIIPGKPRIYINFQELNSDLSDWGEHIFELTFYDYTLVLIDRTYLGRNEYHITIYDDEHGGHVEVLDEDISQLIFFHIAETFKDFVVEAGINNNIGNNNNNRNNGNNNINNNINIVEPPGIGGRRRRLRNKRKTKKRRVSKKKTQRRRR
jgi:hypothetical protein